MNIFIFSQRLRECRKRKFSSQQAFADAYVERFGTIRKPRNKIDSNMFGTIQSWEQGKSTPTAEALSNICILLDCDADYLLGRIDQRTHDINDAHRYTGLSPEALEQLHSFKEEINCEHDWGNDKSLSYFDHDYYKAFNLLLIDEILSGSKSYKLSNVAMYHLVTKTYEEGFCFEKDLESMPNDERDEYREYVQDDRDEIDMLIYTMMNNIRDIIFENISYEKLPNALTTLHQNGCYEFKIK